MPPDWIVISVSIETQYFEALNTQLGPRGWHEAAGKIWYNELIIIWRFADDHEEKWKSFKPKHGIQWILTIFKQHEC